MAKSTNIQNLESMLNEAQIEKEINSILEELGTNDAPEAVESGEADEKEFSANKEDWFDKEENSDDVKEVIVEAEETEKDDDSSKSDEDSKDDEKEDDSDESKDDEKDSKEDESEDDEKDSDDEDKEDEKSEDKEEDSLKEDEELSTNDAPQAVEAGEADEKAFDADEQDYFPGEENADDVASDKANSENQLKEDEELGTNDAPQAVEGGSADEKEFTAGKEDWFDKEENSDDVKEVLVEDEEFLNDAFDLYEEVSNLSDEDFDNYINSLSEEQYASVEYTLDLVEEIIAISDIDNSLNEAVGDIFKYGWRRAREIRASKKEYKQAKKARKEAEKEASNNVVNKATSEYEKMNKKNASDIKKDVAAHAKDPKLGNPKSVVSAADKKDLNAKLDAKKAADEAVANKKARKEDAKKAAADIHEKNKNKIATLKSDLRAQKSSIKALKKVAKKTNNTLDKNYYTQRIADLKKAKNASKSEIKGYKNDQKVKTQEKKILDSQVSAQNKAHEEVNNKKEELRKAVTDHMNQFKTEITERRAKAKGRYDNIKQTNRDAANKKISDYSDKQSKKLVQPRAKEENLKRDEWKHKRDILKEELSEYIEILGYEPTNFILESILESYGISEDYVDENPELVDAQEAGFDDGEADETIVPADAPETDTPEVEKDAVTESFSSIFGILNSINEELSTNDAPQAVESGESDEKAFDATEDDYFPGEENADDVASDKANSENQLKEDEELGTNDAPQAVESGESDEKAFDADEKEVFEGEEDADDVKEVVVEDAQGQGETSEDKQFDVDATLASDAAAEIGTEENQEDIKDKEEECDSCKNESYSSFEEAISLGAEYFAEEEHKNRLIEQVALSIANENGDRLFKEMVEATVLATRLQEAIIAKYNRTATARVQNLIEDMELSTNDAPQAVEAGEADEKAFDADEKDYFPGEENADDVASDKANSENQLKEDEELGTNDAPQAVESGEADEESFDASEDEVFDDEDADDVGEVVVESFTDDMIMEFLTESEMFDATENNVRKIRKAINEGTLMNFYDGELNEGLKNWYHGKKKQSLADKIELLKQKIANEKDPYKKDKLQAKYEKLVQKLDYHTNKYVTKKEVVSVNESVRKPRVATTASERNNK